MPIQLLRARSLRVLFASGVMFTCLGSLVSLTACNREEDQAQIKQQVSVTPKSTPITKVGSPTIPPQKTKPPTPKPVSICDIVPPAAISKILGEGPIQTLPSALELPKGVIHSVCKVRPIGQALGEVEIRVRFTDDGSGTQQKQSATERAGAYVKLNEGFAGPELHRISDLGKAAIANPKLDSLVVFEEGYEITFRLGGPMRERFDELGPLANEFLAVDPPALKALHQETLNHARRLTDAAYAETRRRQNND